VDALGSFAWTATIMAALLLLLLLVVVSHRVVVGPRVWVARVVLPEESLPLLDNADLTVHVPTSDTLVHTHIYTGRPRRRSSSINSV
jgi:membrane glycosyltransferase